MSKNGTFKDREPRKFLKEVETMKRIISAALALVCLLMLAGCGGGNLTDEEEYRKSEEESWGFQFIGEVPEYAQAEALPMADAFAGGSGTEEDPYQIANAAQLARLAYISNVKKDSELYREKSDYLEAWYILTDDIVWNDTSDFENWTEQAPQYAWDPICMIDAFSGVFDGNGHTISGLYMTSVWEPTIRHLSGDTAAFGLFGHVFGSRAPCAIKNVTIKDSLFQLFNVAYDVGGVAGSIANGNIENCHSSVTILVDGSNYVGGIAGTSSKGSISGCSFDGSICGRHKIYSLAGIVAVNGGTSVADCANRGNITPTESTLTMGGIMAEMSDSVDTVSVSDDMTFNVDVKTVRSTAIIENCANYADIAFGGGLVGDLLAFRNDIIIRNCRNEGNIGAAENNSGITGGLIGRLAAYGDNPEKNPGFIGKVTLEDCVNTGTISGIDGQLGGLVGCAAYQNGAELMISGCQNSGAVHCVAGQLGGILGTAVMHSSGEVTLIDCENSGDITSSSGSTGGLVGDVCFTWESEGRHFSITGGKNSGTISGSGYGIGGILGGALGDRGSAGESTEVKNCENAGTINGDLSCFIGGIVGYLPGNENSLTISDCVNTGALNVFAGADYQNPELLKEGDYYGVAGGIVSAAKTTMVMTNCRSSGEIHVEAGITDHVKTAEDIVFYFDEEPVLPYALRKTA